MATAASDPGTPAPSNVVIVSRRSLQGLDRVCEGRQRLGPDRQRRRTSSTSSGGDSMPTWSPDGQWVYYIRRRTQMGSGRVRGVRDDALRPGRDPASCASVPMGAAEPELLATGKFKQGHSPGLLAARSRCCRRMADQSRWSPTRRTPTRATSSSSSSTPRPENIKRAGRGRDRRRSGHQDPEWRPDGEHLLYVKNGRDGARGTPVIVRYDPATKKSRAVTAPGLREPRRTRPTARYFAATRTSNLGTDVVDPRRDATGGSSCGSRTTAPRSARPGRRPGTASPSSISTARPSTSSWPSSKATRRPGRRARRSR